MKKKDIKEAFRRAASNFIIDLYDFTGCKCYDHCKHLRHTENSWCDAFPNSELPPEDIFDGDFDHTKRHPAQKNDIVYEKETNDDIK
jgi:hypothetical protein